MYVPQCWKVPGYSPASCNLPELPEHTGEIACGVHIVHYFSLQKIQFLSFILPYILRLFVENREHIAYNAAKNHDNPQTGAQVA